MSNIFTNGTRIYFFNIVKLLSEILDKSVMVPSLVITITPTEMILHACSILNNISFSALFIFGQVSYTPMWVLNFEFLKYFSITFKCGCDSSMTCGLIMCDPNICGG